jgi:exopolysaccharide biosynthesis polyprenyl glycosylphosphotransferase
MITPLISRTDRQPPTVHMMAGPASRNAWQKQFSSRLLITDSVIVCAAVMLAQYVRFGQAPTSAGYGAQLVTAFSILFAIVWLWSLAVFHTRSARVLGGGAEEYRRTATASFATFGVIAIGTLLAKIEVPRGYLAVALPVGTLGLLLSRSLWRRYVARKRVGGRYQTSVLAIGDLPSVSLLADELTRNPKEGYVVVGVGISGHGAPIGDVLTVHGRQVPILGDETYALAAIDGCGADTVMVTGTEHFGVHGIRKLVWQLERRGVDLVVLPGVMDIAGARLVMRQVASLPLLHVERPQYLGAQRFQKRAFDFCFSLAALALTAPVLVAAAIGIKLTSRGPVFYPSERIGLDGKPFTMLKFRTMMPGADTQIEDLLPLNEIAGGMLFKLHKDPRVTPVGRLLRRFSIDELPQFINVLKQNMSVVGPRPPLRREVERYDGEVRRRLLVKPGITGLWQVSGRCDLSFEESVRLDLSYVENWSMVGDLVIVAKTVNAVLTGQGAY